MIAELNRRSREILRALIEAYVESGEPIGSRALTARLGLNLSAATIRNVMADLEATGLLFSPHTSAGRIPTEAGLQLFVDGLLEIGRLNDEERRMIDHQCTRHGRNVQEVLEEVSTTLSGLSHCAGLVFAPKGDARLRHIEFVMLGPGRALVVIVMEDGTVENRVLDIPLEIPASSLVMASNYLNTRLAGRTMIDARQQIVTELQENRIQLDALTRKLIHAGLEVGTGQSPYQHMIVRGQAQLLDNITALEDLEKIRVLFNALEAGENFLKLLEQVQNADSVQVFIGAENTLFGMAGCSMIVAPYNNGQGKIIGAIGVIGPTRMNYGRIIPLVDYTAKIVSSLIGA